MWSNRAAFQTLWHGANFISLVSRLEQDGEKDEALRRRRCLRWALDAPAVLLYQGGGDKQTVTLCRVRDVGRKGIGLGAREPVPENMAAEVFVFIEGAQYTARVQVAHCRSQGISYHVGCEFESE